MAQKIKSLNLSSLRIEKLDHRFIMKNLNSINATDCKISKIDGAVFSEPKETLSKVNLSKNLIQAIPNELTVCVHLQVLNLSHN
mmetsp:Transcript_3714/g.4727  ORF Transcript_3714/g.4727 Transcript_3714/m.4727 type:complete len:84 (+) Transcript_3714:1-252(+)